MIATQEQLDELRSLLAAATPGPWEYTEGVFKHYVTIGEHHHFGLQEMAVSDGHTTNAQADAQLIAQAPTALALLLDTIKAMQQGSLDGDAMLSDLPELYERFAELRADLDGGDAALVTSRWPEDTIAISWGELQGLFSRLFFLAGMVDSLTKVNEVLHRQLGNR